MAESVRDDSWKVLGPNGEMPILMTGRNRYWLHPTDPTLNEPTTREAMMRVLGISH